MQNEADSDGQRLSSFLLVTANDELQEANTEIFIARLHAVATHKTTFDDPMPLITRARRGRAVQCMVEPKP